MSLTQDNLAIASVYPTQDFYNMYINLKNYPSTLLFLMILTILF